MVSENDRAETDIKRTKKSDTNKIKLCPFCGMECNVLGTTFGDSMTKYYRVECDGIMGHCLDHWSDTKEEAIEAWNRRAYAKR